MKKILTTTIMTLASSAIFAANISFDGTVDVKIKPNTRSAAVNTPLQFQLPKYKLSESAKQVLKKHMLEYKANGPSLLTTAEIPSQVQLGMKGTPVLNQGYHGSCVTFAVTAAYDAALEAGDYISQLCNLELGSYLSIHDKSPVSGWNGSFGSWVLSQIHQYGIVSKNHQTLQGCAGVKEYPLTEENNEGNPMTEAEFKQHSVDISKLVTWSPILDEMDAFTNSADMADVINRVRQELALGNRLTFGTLLDVYVGQAGAVGQYKQPYDTWMLTPEIIADAVYGNINAGHEMVITGYDDNAIVMDEEGHANRGLFTLRNSWSSLAGDNGNYYMSYDHFYMLAMGVQLITRK